MAACASASESGEGESRVPGTVTPLSLRQGGVQQWPRTLRAGNLRLFQLDLGIPLAREETPV